MLEADRGAHDFADRDPAAFARQFVAAARSAHALEDLGVDKALQQRFQMAGRQLVARRKRLGRDRRRTRMQRDVDNGGDGEQTASRQQVHFIPPPIERPVDPNPLGRARVVK